MLNMKKIAYMAVGVILFLTTIFTGKTGLSEENIEIYKKAVDLQPKVEEIGFADFYLEDYTVAFYDGKNDYVLENSDTDIEVKKRKPVLDTLVATAWEVDGEYQVLCPTVEKLKELVDMAGAYSQAQTADGDTEEYESIEETYTDKSHVATIWHEAFHCYQLTHYEEGIEKLLGSKEADGTLIVSEVDGNEEVVKLYKKEMELLEKAINENDLDVVKEIILEYKELDEKRKEFLSEECQLAEAYYTVMEGTAFYVEKLVYANLSSEADTDSKEIQLDLYAEGTNKYYNIGRAQCLILDKLNPDWKSDYDFSCELIDVMLTFAQ